MASDPLSVTLELVEVIDPPLTPTSNQLATTDFVEASYTELWVRTFTSPYLSIEAKSSMDYR